MITTPLYFLVIYNINLRQQNKIGKFCYRLELRDQVPSAKKSSRPTEGWAAASSDLS
jgi:hypothetical protein